MRRTLAWSLAVLVTVATLPSARAQDLSPSPVRDNSRESLKEFSFHAAHGRLLLASAATAASSRGTASPFLSGDGSASVRSNGLVGFNDLGSGWNPGLQNKNKRVDTGRLVLGGVAGGLAGVGVGLLGTLSCSEDDWCFGPIFIGMGVEIIGVPLGVHLANERKGNYLLDALGSIGAVVLGVLVIQASEAVNLRWGNAGGPAFLLFVPAAQIGFSIALERRSE